MSDLEPESQDSVRARRGRRFARSLGEFVLAGLFVAALLGGRFSGESKSLAALSALAAVAVLCAWFGAHVYWHRRLDEFERAVELRALAFAGGATVLFAAGWGIFESFLAAPDFPIALLAPVFAVVYAVARFILASGYR